MFEGLLCIRLGVVRASKKDREAVIKNNAGDFKINDKERTWKIALSLGSEITFGR